MIATANPEVTNSLFQPVKPNRGHMTGFNSVLGNFHQKQDSWSHAKTAKPVHSGFGVCFLFSPATRKSSLPKKKYLDMENLSHLTALGKISERPVPNGNCNVGYQRNPAHLRLCELCGLATVIKEFNQFDDKYFTVLEHSEVQPDDNKPDSFVCHAFPNNITFSDLPQCNKKQAKMLILFLPPAQGNSFHFHVASQRSKISCNYYCV